MRPGVVVQARMSSRRLPGKVLAPVEGKPLLGHLLDRLFRLGLPVVVATSREESDNPVADFCQREGVSVFRGSLDDVARRLLEASEEAGFDPFVRVCADSLFLDTGLIRTGLVLYEEKGASLVTNVCPRSFPKGQSVEVIGRRLLAEGMACFSDPADFEHVTRHFYRRAPFQGLVNFQAAEDYSSAELQVDTPAQMAGAEALLRAMTRPPWEYGWKDLLSLQKRLPLRGPA